MGGEAVTSQVLNPPTVAKHSSGCGRFLQVLDAVLFEYNSPVLALCGLLFTRGWRYNSNGEISFFWPVTLRLLTSVLAGECCCISLFDSPKDCIALLHGL